MRFENNCGCSKSSPAQKIKTYLGSEKTKLLAQEQDCGKVRCAVHVFSHGRLYIGIVGKVTKYSIQLCQVDGLSP